MRKSVHIEKLPSGNYSVRYFEGSSFKREWFEDFSLATRRAADLTLKLTALKQGALDPTLRPIDILNRYLESIQHTHRPVTVKMKRDNLIDFISHSQHLTNQRIKDWKKEMLKKYSISTVSIRLRDAKALCKWANKEGLITDNVFEGIEVPAAKEVGRKLSTEELQAIWEHSDTKFKTFLGFLIFTGARKGEILKATWSDLDIPNRIWHIPAANCKTKQERFVPIDNALVDLLNTLPKTPGFVFPWSRHAPQWLLTKACAKAKLDKPRIHDFRHTFASHWKGDPGKLMKMVGWRSEAMIRRYSHFTVEDLKKEAETKGISSGLRLE